jgi:predicted MFS family arabinose efflux permease
VSVEIFPFVFFGGIGVLAVVGIVSFRPGPEQHAGEPDGAMERRLRTMKRIRDVCWVALVIAAIGVIAYVMIPARATGP